MSTSNAHRASPPSAHGGGAGDPSFDFESLLEAQTRLWNHLLDANRSFWSFYTPWMPGAAWGLDSASVPDPIAEVGTEPATTSTGLPDAFELQTRSWNRFLDAQRSFWSALNWPVPPTPWTLAANEDAAADAEPNVIDADDGPTHSARAPAKKSRSGAAAKTRRSARAR